MKAIFLLLMLLVLMLLSSFSSSFPFVRACSNLVSLRNGYILNALRDTLKWCCCFVCIVVCYPCPWLWRNHIKFMKIKSKKKMEHLKVLLAFLPSSNCNHEPCTLYKCVNIGGWCSKRCDRALISDLLLLPSL